MSSVSPAGGLGLVTVNTVVFLTLSMGSALLRVVSTEKVLSED